VCVCVFVIAVVAAYAVASVSAKHTHHQYGQDHYSRAVKKAFVRLHELRDKLRHAKLGFTQTKERVEPLIRAHGHAKTAVAFSLQKYHHRKTQADAAWKVLNEKNDVLKNHRLLVVAPAQKTYEDVMKDALSMDDLRQKIAKMERERAAAGQSSVQNDELQKDSANLAAFDDRRSKALKDYQDAKANLQTLIDDVQAANDVKNKAVVVTDRAHNYHTQMLKVEADAATRLADATRKVINAKRRMTRYRHQVIDAVRHVHEHLKVRAAAYHHRVQLAKTRFTQASKRYYGLSRRLPGKRDKVETLKAELAPLPGKRTEAESVSFRTSRAYTEASAAHKRAQDKFLYWAGREGAARGALIRFVTAHGWGEKSVQNAGAKKSSAK